MARGDECTGGEKKAIPLLSYINDFCFTDIRSVSVVRERVVVESVTAWHLTSTCLFVNTLSFEYLFQE